MSRIIITFAVGTPTRWFRENLDDFIWILDRNLKNSSRGVAEGRYENGILTVTATGIPMPEVQAYVDVFAESMRRHGQKLIVNISDAD
ncbi:MAG: hypothetical protein JXO49_02800 [Deltaproteobacteria bacterium]|nr:hypothetical protein [Candidatus Anaeroferrophillus wilburensis]MBN2888258.1 hypothetical protein [Deltaproteobacteria bacterium]